MWAILHFIVVRVILLFVDFWNFLKDFFQVNICRRHLIVNSHTIINPLSDDRARRIAVFAAYPSDDSIPFTVHALRGLRENGFYVLFVTTGTMRPNWVSALDGLVDQYIERDGVGRDYGSFRMGLSYIGLLADGIPQGCETLVIANDSLYFPSSFVNAVKGVIEQNAPFGALFRCMRDYVYGQGFFLTFSQEIFRHPDFKRYWTEYKCYSSRKYMIRFGEVELSSVIRKIGFPCQPYYSPKWLNELLRNRLQTIGDLRALIELLRLSSPTRQGVVAIHTSLYETFTAKLLMLSNKPAESLLLNEARARLVQLAETDNPTHELGLVWQVLAGAPLKRDVFYRGIFSVQQVLDHVEGFNSAELTAMGRDLARKALPKSGKWMDELLYVNGRI